MSRPIAAIIGDIDHLLSELARRVDGEERVTPIRPMTPKTNRQSRVIVRPEGESDPLAQALARRLIIERGLVGVKR